MTPGALLSFPSSAAPLFRSSALPPSPWYGLAMLAGFVVTAIVWSRMFRGRPELAVVYVVGLLGALIGAKAGYLAAELPVIWALPGFWYHVAVGKTILGALLGGYAGVEAGKRLIGVREATGDRFALLVPAGLAIGRVGCLLHGCCLGIPCAAGWWALDDPQGVPRLPAPLIEAAFNVLALGVIGACYRRRLFPGQLFHGYLLAYGLFRIAHEPLRNTPRLELSGGMFLTPYQLLALGLITFTLWRMAARRRQTIAERSGTVSA